jgi:hypothetical protein
METNQADRFYRKKVARPDWKQSAAPINAPIRNRERLL